jgi:N-acetylneuraminic acid mutarotase
VVSGLDVEEYKRKMYSYDLDQDDWDNELSLGGETGSGLERASAVGFSGGGYGFVALGAGASSPLKDTWRYDPESDSWTQVADYLGSARIGAVAFVIDNIAYVGTGQDEDGLTSDFYSYTIATNTWHVRSDFAGGSRKEAVGFTMGGKGYVGTGRGPSGYLADFWEYDTSHDEWTEKAELPGAARIGAVGCAIFPKAYVMLGEDSDFNYREDVWEYNYFGDIWTQRANFAGGTRSQSNAIVVDNRIFVGLGYNGIYHDDFYEYQPLPVGIDSYETAEINVYPNPVITDFTIKFNAPISQPWLQLYSANGMDISNIITIESFTNLSCSVHLTAALSAGIYFLVLIDDNRTIGTKSIRVN